MVPENKNKTRYHIFFFFIRKYPKRDNSWSDFIKRKSQYTIIVFLLLVLGLYFHSHVQLVTNPVKTTFYQNVDRRSFNKSLHSKPEVRHIAFLKVHKAGSSTVQNILFRYGIKRGLMFVIPAKGGKFSSNAEDHEVVLDPLHGDRHDILAVHSVYNREIYAKHLWDDSKYIAIVREPLDLMISGAYYHRDRWHVNYLTKVPDDNFITNLIRYPEIYDNNTFSLTRNSMAMDFGFPEGIHVGDKKVIRDHMTRLDNEFDLVLILEHFPESLVLMRRAFNWPFSSIVYIPLNDNKHPTAYKLNISGEDRKQFDKRNFLDVAIYDYFYDAFMTTLSKEGEDFYEEVQYFERVLTRVQLYCVVSYKSSEDFVVGESEWNERFSVSATDCDDMKMTELTFIERLRDERVRQLYQEML